MDTYGEYILSSEAHKRVINFLFRMEARTHFRFRLLLDFIAETQIIPLYAGCDACLLLDQVGVGVGRYIYSDTIIANELSLDNLERTFPYTFTDYDVKKVFKELYNIESEPEPEEYRFNEDGSLIWEDLDAGDLDLTPYHTLPGDDEVNYNTDYHGSSEDSCESGSDGGEVEGPDSGDDFDGGVTKDSDFEDNFDGYESSNDIK